jgi:hypothetical protein
LLVRMLSGEVLGRGNCRYLGSRMENSRLSDMVIGCWLWSLA